MVRDRQPLVQSLGRDSSRFQREMIDGCERATREHIPANTGEGDDERQTQDEDQQDLRELLAHALLGA